MRTKGFRLLLTILVTISLAAGGCAHVHRRHALWQQVGMASWYGRDFHGKPTASGETYNMYALTAAHKTLPLGSLVKVTNLSNGKHVVVRINDRGPFVGSRIIDMSYGAARRLGMVKTGVAKVRVEVLRLPKNCKFLYTLQFGAFRDRKNANQVIQRLEEMGYKPVVDSWKAHGHKYYRVRLGLFRDISRARETEENFDSAGIPCIVIAL